MLCVIVAGYIIYLNLTFDLQTSGIIALITWSFFVLCTPIADAGFLLDFPIRLCCGIRMIVSEIIIWGIAISLSIALLTYSPKYYQSTPLTKIFYMILTKPIPYWSIIILSGIGTLLSIRFGDELMDILHHKDRHFFHQHGYKHELLVMVVLLLLVIAGYYELVASLHIPIEY